MSAGLHQSCLSNFDCSYLHECVSHDCVHKSLFPIAAYEVLAALSVFLVSLFSQAAGVSHCAVTTPLLIVIGGFTVHQSIPIVHLVTLTCGLVTVLSRLDRRLPNTNRPEVDYLLAMHMCVPLLVGVCCGVAVNAVAPDWAVLGALSAGLWFAAYGSYSK